MEPFRFDTQDSFGRPQVETFRLDYPLIASVAGPTRGLPIGSSAATCVTSTTPGHGRLPGGRFRSRRRPDRAGLEERPLGGRRRAAAALRAALPPPGLRVQRQPHHLRGLAIQRGLAADHPAHASAGVSYVFDNGLLSIAYGHAFENEVAGRCSRRARRPFPTRRSRARSRPIRCRPASPSGFSGAARCLRPGRRTTHFFTANHRISDRRWHIGRRPAGTARAWSTHSFRGNGWANRRRPGLCRRA